MLAVLVCKETRETVALGTLELVGEGLVVSLSSAVFRITFCPRFEFEESQPNT